MFTSLKKVEGLGLAVVILIILAGHIYFAFSADKRNMRELREDFTTRQQAFMAEFTKDMRLNRALLRTGRAFFQTDGNIEGATWREFVDALNYEDAHPGLEAFGYAKRIPVSDADMNLVQPDGDERLKVVDDGAEQIGEQEGHVAVVTHVVRKDMLPSNGLLGYNFYSNPLLRETLMRASTEGDLAVSPVVPFSLEETSPPRDGVFLIAPKFISGSKDSEPQVAGYVFAFLRHDHLLEQVLGSTSDGIKLNAYDRSSHKADNLIFNSRHAYDEINAPRYFPPMVSEHDMDVGDRKWALEFSTLPRYGQFINRGAPILILLVGVFLAALTFFVTWSMCGAKRYAEGIADEKVKELEASENRFRVAIASAGIGIGFVDFNGKWLKVNKSLSEMFGYTEYDFLSLTISSMIDHSHVDTTLDMLNRFRSGQDFQFKEEQTYVRKDGSNIGVLFAAGLVKDANDEPLYVVVQLVDISERLEYAQQLTELKDSLEVEVQNRTQELTQQRDIAERANKSKDEFLANMSHELRTPLNSILGLTKILISDHKMSKEAQETLKVIDMSSTTLLQIVNDVLDIAKIEAEAVTLEKAPFNLADMCFGLLDQIKPLADEKGLELYDNFFDCSHINVIGDEFRFSRVLTNLMTNAVKYTEKGSVSFQVEIEDRDDGECDFSLTVKDTGIGIPPEKIEHIFDKFTQVEESKERKFGGTGLGLNIAKKLIDIMDGDISVESEIGVGSIFKIHVPFEKAADSDVVTQNVARVDVTMAAGEKVAQKDARILIAEDHELNQILILKLMKRMGFKNYELVSNGRQAYEEYIKGDYNLVLMDCHMPEMNGYEATRWIRRHEDEQNTDNPVGIIAVTADAMQGTKEKCLKAGMDYYISKPIDADELKRSLEIWIEFEEADGDTQGGRDVDTNKEGEVASGNEGDEDAPVDLSALRNFTEGDFEEEKRLIGVFVDRGKAEIEQLSESKAKTKSDSWQQAAHKLKGSSAYVGAKDLSALCHDAQMKSELSAKEKKQLLNDISSEFDRVVIYLRECGYL